MHCGYFAVSLDIVYFVFIYFRRKGDETKNCKARRGAAPVALAGRSGARSTEPERGVVGSPHRVAVGVGAASCVRHTALYAEMQMGPAIACVVLLTATLSPKSDPVQRPQCARLQREARAHV